MNDKINLQEKKPFAPFVNDAQSMQIGNLIIENQTDKITIYGDIDLYADKQGLEQAKHLQTLLTNVICQLEGQGNLPKNHSNRANVAGQMQIRKVAGNPFA